MLALPLALGCARSAWVTPVAVLPPRPSSCPVTVATAPHPGTKVLALVHCGDGFWSVGTTCAELVRQKACEVGGDVMFGAHWEGDFDLVVTVCAEPRSSSADSVVPVSTGGRPGWQPLRRPRSTPPRPACLRRPPPSPPR